MSDDLERTLHDSLSRHAAQLGRPAGTIETVYERVTRRRARRRAVAGFGSLAIAAVGVIGIATVGRGGSDAPAAQGEGDGNAWACSGFLGGAGDTTYYTDCRRIDDVPVTTVVCAPSGTAPVTWVDTTSLDTTFVETTSIAEPVAEPANATAEACLAPATTSPLDTLPSRCGAPTTAVPMTTLEPAGTTTTIVFVSACEPHEQIYTVQKGDSVYGISALFGIDPDALARYNEWPEGINHGLEPGDLIMIPAGYIKPAPPTTTTVELAIDVTEAPPTTVPVATAP